VKLASKLVGWHIEVRAEGQVEDALKRAEGLFTKKPEEIPAEVPPPDGEVPAAAPPEGSLPAESSADEMQAEAGAGAKEGAVVEAKPAEPAVASPAKGTDGETKAGSDPPKA
jgi:hypothetical protein